MVFLSSFLATLITAGAATAGPTGGRIVAGDGAISANAARTDIHQSSERLGIEWRDFSIGPGEQVNFNQPSRTAVALNRVTGNQISNIEGLLTANGNVFVINPNGILFHRSAEVDVGGLLATTKNISDRDFLAGRYRFDQGGSQPGGHVVNEGRISAAEGGLVALVAPSVRNAGVIEARLGRVALASGNTFTLDLFGDELVSFAVGDGVAQELAGDSAPVEHGGTIAAPGGRVWLTANAARGVVDNVINLSGVVQARTVANRDGRIVLQGGQAGGVRVAGRLDATGGFGPGGRIEVLGESIELTDSARLDVSGGRGGGTTLVGGDYLGRGNRQRAVRTTVAAGATIRADATDDGDGGTVVVWSEERTVVNGDLSARGGPAGGDGGLVETSSAGELVFNRPVRVSAPAGRAGTWLMDPEDIQIGRSQADSIESTLNEGGNVSIKTADAGDGEGNITVNASITKTEGDDASLSLTAHNRIDVNKPIRSESGKLNVSLKAGRAVDVNAGVETNGGRFSSHTTGVPEPEVSADPEAGGTDDTDTETAEDDTHSPSADDTTAEASDDESSGNTEQTGTAGEETNPYTGDENESSGNDEPVADSDGEDPGANDQIDDLDGSDNEVTDTDTDSIESVEHVAATGSEADGPATNDTPYIVVRDTVATLGGDISVDAGETGTAVVTGALDASNSDSGETGGDIEVLGEHVVLAGDAEVDASGDAGGGDIHIGGDYQGQGDRHNARTTTVGKNVTIRSDATGEGDGGTVVVWADDTTRFSGHISARGGPEGGDGGDIEVSGKQNLGFWGTVDVAAPQGQSGTLLLDPETLTVIDAIRGQGELDLNILCAANNRNCWLPPGVLAGTADWTEELIESFGFELDPETPLNTVTWDRLIQLAQATGFGLKLEAEQDITIAELTGTISTPGSPVGGTNGYTITVPLRDISSPAYEINFFSKHGDIVFENPDDNLAVLGGYMVFRAPEGELRLGNLYGMGRPVPVTSDTPTGFSWGTISLTAGGDIQTGTINTRTVPGRFADPVTGAPLPQEIVIDPNTFDPSPLVGDRIGFLIDPEDYPDVIINSPALVSDFRRGGPVFITSTGGNIDILGPVYTANGTFRAEAPEGTFTATHIDTGANRYLVKTSESDPGRLNTLNTGAVKITAEKISFDQINSGQVEFDALLYAPDAINGTVVIDSFYFPDFIDGRIPAPDLIPFIDGTEPGLSLNVAPTVGCLGDCIDDLVFTLDDLGQSTLNLGFDAGDELAEADSALGLDGTVQMELDSSFVFTGGARSGAGQRVPMAMIAGPLGLVLAPNPVPVLVPLGLPANNARPAAAVIASNTGPAPRGGLGSPPSGDAGDDGGSPSIAFVETTAAETERIQTEDGQQQAQDSAGDCEKADRLAWLQDAPRSAARQLDWGRRAGIGTGPSDTGNIFGSDNCYFTSAAPTTSAGIN